MEDKNSLLAKRENVRRLEDALLTAHERKRAVDIAVTETQLNNARTELTR